jgi:nucleoside-diphosphate-sugar epimerase
MNVLVTGHHGHIGSVLAPYLADPGHDVTGLHTRFYRGCDFVPERVAVVVLTLDVRDVTSADLDGFDAIVLAALSNDPLGDLNPSLTKDINGHGTPHLARAAREPDVREFVFASSGSMYGASGTDATLDEATPLQPPTRYAGSKVRGEEGLVELARPDFVPVSQLRSPTSRTSGMLNAWTRARRRLPRGRSYVGGLRRQPVHPFAPAAHAARRGRARQRSSPAFAGGCIPRLAPGIRSTCGRHARR